MKVFSGVLLILLLTALRAGLSAQTLWTANLDGAQESPPVTTSGTGTAWAVLSADSKTLTFRMTFARLNKPATAAHFHAGGTGKGGVVHPVTIVGNTASGTWTNVPDTIITHLLNGEIYLNVHTSTSPGGEIRGYLHPIQGTGFIVSMDASQEPGGVVSGAQGTAYAVLDSSQYQLDFAVTIAGLSASLTGSHFHTLPSGSVVHPITFTDSTTQGSWVGLSAANLTSLFGGLLYLNVHSTNYSGGEIRGMVLPIGSALPTAVNAAPSVTPAQFRLEQNYPNPFNPSTTIEYTVGGVGIQASGVSLVRLSVYDVLGRQVAVLVDGAQAAGNYRVTFDASGLPSGVYLYRLSAGSATVQTKTMTIMK